MPDNTTTEQILFEIKVNSAAFQTEQKQLRDALAQLTLDIEKNRAATKQLDTTRKAGKVGDAEYAQQSVKLREELNKYRADQRQLTKELDTLQKVYQSGEGSIAQYRARLSELTATYNALAAAERDGAEGQQLAGTIKATSAELLKLEASLNNHTRNVGNYGSAWVAAGQQVAGAAKQEIVSTQAAAGSIAALRQELTALEAKRETLAPVSKEAEELSVKILETKSRLQQSLGVIDEFGERVKRNVKSEQFDTLTDALSGLTAGLGTATILFSDNETAAKAEAQALKLASLATNARTIAIGLAAAPEAIQIGLLKAKNLLFKEEATTTAAAAVSTEAHAAVAGADAAAVGAQAAAAGLNAEAQAASTAGTAANTVATEAQAAATGKATVFQALLNRVMLLSPIGWLVLAVGALVGAFLAYSNASDKTQARVKDFTKALLLFTNPIGLAVVGIQALYSKFESVRKVLDPLIEKVEQFGAVIGAKAHALGEFVGLLDTAAEKAAKLAKQEFEQAEQQMALYEAQAKAQELAGQRIENVRATQRKKLELDITRTEKLAATEREANQEKLQDIARRKAADEDLSKSQQELLNKTLENENRVQTARNNLRNFELEGIELVRFARAQAAADMEGNTQRAADTYRRQLEEGIANQKALLQSRISTLDRGLALVRLNSVEELELQRKRIAAQRNLDLANLGPTLAQERAARAQNLSRILADQKTSEKLALSAFGLTAEQKQHIENEYRNKAADTRLAFSTAEAQREVSARQDIIKNAAAADTKLTVDHLRQTSILSLQAEQERNSAALALNAKAQAERAVQGLQATQQQLDEEYQLQSKTVRLERELALASLNQRADNAAAELRIRAEASQKLAAINAAQADAERQRRAKELSEQAQYDSLLADGMLAGHTQAEQQQLAATETYKQQRIAAVLDEQDARLVVVAAGSQEEVNIRQDTENKIKQIQQDSQQAQLDLLRAQTEKVASIITSSLSSLATIQDADSQDKLARIEAEENLATTSAARHAVLEKQKLRVEQQAAEQRKKIAKAQAVISLGQAVMTILSSPAAPFIEPAASIVRGIEIAAATATAYAQFRTIDSQKFSAGGMVAVGPSHSQGGIQLLHRGRHAGIEIEGGEAIINRRSTALFGPVLSAINQLGGGRALYQDPKPASWWAQLAEGGIVPRDLPDYLPQVRTGGVVVHVPPIDYDKLAAAAPQIDYERLGQAVAKHAAPAFIAGAQSLPPPETNIVELSRRLKQQEDFQKQIDN